MVTISNHVKDTLIAPGASQFTQADIPDMSSEYPGSQNWIPKFFLNSMLRAAWKPPLNAYVYNYLRRSEAAFREHAAARTASLRFVDGQRQSPSSYALAISHWEHFLSESWHAYNTLGKAFRIPLFERDDRSVEQRLNALYNTMKHAESYIERGEILDGATVPVWLANQGLKSVNADLSFSETGAVLRDIAKWANVLEDPLSCGDRLSREFARNDGSAR